MRGPEAGKRLLDSDRAKFENVEDSRFDFLQ